MKIFAVAVAACSVITSAAMSIADTPIVYDHNGNVDVTKDPLVHALADAYANHRLQVREITLAFESTVVNSLYGKENFTAMADSLNAGLNDIQQMMEKNEAYVEQFKYLSRMLEAKYL